MRFPAVFRQTTMLLFNASPMMLSTPAAGENVALTAGKTRLSGESKPTNIRFRRDGRRSLRFPRRRLCEIFEMLDLSDVEQSRRGAWTLPPWGRVTRLRD